MSMDELKDLGLSKQDLDRIAGFEDLPEDEQEALAIIEDEYDSEDFEDLPGLEGDASTPIGRAAVAATLAATLLVPSAALATEVILDEPAAIIQTIDMNAPDDNPPAVDDSAQQDKSHHNMRKLLLRALAGVLGLLLALLVACAAGLFDSLGPLGCGDSSGAAADGTQMSLLLETDEGMTASTEAIVDVRDPEGSVLVDDEDVEVNQKEILTNLEPGDYLLVFEKFPEASDGTVFRPDTDATPFHVDEEEYELVIHLRNAG